ncbi:pilus assembly protein TadD [Cupriavidus basilensis]|uniref:pilus assembly protein TadD n=1 Tax=Cupriavidus basilensis TaxID=68895 RepID=UPI0020C5C332|nr:pilus assembly protein TadD [Cupriavidus basilensis]
MNKQDKRSGSKTRYRSRWLAHSSTALAATLALAVLSGCGTSLATRMSDQADAQVELSKLRDKQDRAIYDDKSVYLGLIGKMQEEGLYFASLAHIDVYEKRFGASPAMTLMRADALRETNQDAAAEQAYRSLAGTSVQARAYHGLGLIAGRRNDFAAAATAFQLAAGADPTNAQVANDLGYALMRTGALPEARVPVMQALQLDGKNPRVVSNAAVWLAADGKRDQAASLMQRAGLPEATRKAVLQEAERVRRASTQRERVAAQQAVAQTAPQSARLAATGTPGPNHQRLTDIIQATP